MVKGGSKGGGEVGFLASFIKKKTVGHVHVQNELAVGEKRSKIDANFGTDQTKYGMNPNKK